MSTDGRLFRKSIGFTNAESLKKYYKATDIVEINWKKIERFNQRIKDMFTAINEGLHITIRYKDLRGFYQNIDNAYAILRENNIIPRMCNYGRAPEGVYYSWMRGYAVQEFFAGALAVVFGVSPESFRKVGHDQLSSIETFSQSPTADLEVVLNGKTVRLEIQSGFTGVNDIKEHKVKEAKGLYFTMHALSYIVHFDLFNGLVAIIDISNIDDKSVHWENRAQFESQRVFSIPETAFKWSLSDAPSSYMDIVF